MHKRVIIFDFDSTLVDSLGFWMKTIEKLTYKKYGMKVDKRLSGITHGGNNIEKAKKVIDILGVEDDYKDVLNCWLEQMRYFYTHDIRFIKGAKEFLYELKDRGEKLVIASATDKETLKIALKHFDIDIFEDIFTEADLNISKNDPLFYETCLKILETDKKSGMFFEDSFSAIKTATEFGIECIGILNKFNKQHKKELKRMCSFVIKDYKNMKSL